MTLDTVQFGEFIYVYILNGKSMEAPKMIIYWPKSPFRYELLRGIIQSWLVTFFLCIIFNIEWQTKSKKKLG